MTVTTDSFGLTVQLLPDPYRLLAVAQVVAMRNGTKRFRPAEVEALFRQLRIPPPPKISNRLTTLKQKSSPLVMSQGAGVWSLTPIGDTAVAEAIGDIDLAALSAELADVPGAEFADTTHPLISPAYAPPKWRHGIERLLEQFPFERNVFCMTRFPADDSDPLAPVIKRAREVLRDHGLTLHLASDRQADDELFGNVAAHMWACQYGVGLIEDLAGRGLNYNVVIELGSMIITGRRCTMLKDASGPDLPTDLTSQIYKPTDFGDLDAVGSTLDLWVTADLNLASSAAA